MSSNTRTWLVVAAVALSVAAMVVWFRREKAAEEVARVEQDTQHRAEREAEVVARWERIREESAALMPDVVSDVRLGMRIDEVRALRPAIARSEEIVPDPGLVDYEERLANGSRVHYVFEESSELLQRIQILSLLPQPDAIVPHLQAMDERYGPPTGVWDCPDTGGISTRRFTWRREDVSMMDIFVVVGSRVSLTLYLAPTHVVGQSLVRSRCHPSTREDLDRFPVTSPADMQAVTPP